MDSVGTSSFSEVLVGAQGVHGRNGDTVGTSGADRISNTSSYATIEAGAGSDTIMNTGSNVKIYAGEGDDSIRNSGMYVTIDAGSGNDTVSNSMDRVSINGGAGNDSIHSYGFYVSVDTGEGDDTIETHIHDASHYGYFNAGAGNDMLLIVDSFISLYGGAGDDTFIGASNHGYINLGDGNDKISMGSDFYESDYATIVAGKGDDTVTLDSNTALFYHYAEGDGNDIVFDLYSGDTINITSGSISSAGIRGNDYILYIGDGSITFKDAANTRFKVIANGQDASPIVNQLNILGTNDADTITTSLGGAMVDAMAGNDSVAVYGSRVSVSGGDGNDSITNGTFANGGGSSVTMDGGAGDDYFYNTGQYALVNGGEGNDEINNWSQNLEYTRYATLNGGDGDDTITNGSHNVLINGDAGNDVIKNYGNNVTMNGGAGDDSLTQDNASNGVINGGAGKDTINLWLNSDNAGTTVDAGEDDDVISNYGGLEFVSKEDTTKVLEVAKGSTANGANVQILTRNGTDAQRWSITRIG